MKLVHKKHDDQPIEQAISTDVDVTAPSAGNITMAAVAPEEVSGEISVQSLERQHLAALDEQKRLEFRRDQLAAETVAKQSQLEELAVRAAGGEDAARNQVRELRASIADIQADVETVALAIKKTAERVALLFRAHDQALATQERAAAAQKVSRLFDTVLEADRAFLTSVANVLQNYTRLQAQLQLLRSDELAQAAQATNVRSRLSQAHNDLFSSIPEIHVLQRAIGGPVFLNLVRPNAL